MKLSLFFQAKKKTVKCLPEIIHADNTARVQTVSLEENSKFYKLIEEFKKLSSYPILINTSMNVDSPIVCSPTEAFDTFLKTDVEDLFLNNWHIEKIKT